MMKRIYAVLFLFAILACESNDATESRSFYMGFTVDQRQEQIDKIMTNSDIINYDFGYLPWSRLMQPDSTSYDIQRRWLNIRRSLPGNHKLYISVSPFFLDRNIKGTNNANPEALLDGIDSLSFSNQNVRKTYLEYCKQIIDFFHPAFFSIASRANILFLNNPDAWDDFLGFHWYVYNELKLLYPSTVVFTTVAAEPTLSNFNQTSDYLLQRTPIFQLMESSDLYALSISSDCLSSALRLNNRAEFSGLFNISGKPFALLLDENSTHSVETKPPPIPNCEDFNIAIKACLSRKAVFVVNSISLTHETPLQRNHGYTLSSDSTPFYFIWKKYLSLDMVGDYGSRE